MRRTLLKTVVLFTFLLGSALGVLHRSILDSFRQPAKIEPFLPPLSSREFLTPLRIGVFIGVDGITLSADGKKFERYQAYKERENIIQMSPAELSKVAYQLITNGLLEEAEFNAPASIDVPPQTYTILLAWPDSVRQFTWASRDECKVPEKYLLILERLNSDLKLPLIKNFIASNRRQI
jgi:hypothetical protein